MSSEIKKIYNFKFEDFKFEDVSKKKFFWTKVKSRKNNSIKYINWVIDVLSKEYGKELQKNEIFNAISIEMNEKNLTRLYNVLLDYIYLDIAPTTNNMLSDDSYSINIDEMIVNDKKYIKKN